MPTRSYGQYCSIARALDVIGSRWALLVVRELTRGPARYTDLLEGLPGVAPDVLASRLRDLQTNGIIERRNLPPPAGSVAVYELTPVGKELEPIVASLGAWGMRFLDERGEAPFDPRWLTATIKGLFRPEAIADLDCTIGIRFPEGDLYLTLRDGTVATDSVVSDPDVSVETDVETLVRVVQGSRPVEEALASGAMAISGSDELVARLALALVQN